MTIKIKLNIFAIIEAHLKKLYNINLSSVVFRLKFQIYT